MTSYAYLKVLKVKEKLPELVNPKIQTHTSKICTIYMAKVMSLCTFVS